MVFIDRHLRRSAKHIGACLIFQFRPQRHQEGIRKFDKIRIRPLHRASPEDEIGHDRKENNHHGQNARVPKRQTRANGIKHGSCG